MESKDPNSTKNIGERHTGAKVVQLPREWLGPTEELVPFGVSANAAPPTATAPPPSAQSFWTEDAASLHAALQGAAPPDEETTPPPRRTRTRRLGAPRGLPHLKRRAAPLLAFTGVALGSIALIGDMWGSAPRPVPARGRASSARLAAPPADFARNAADWRLLARVRTAADQRDARGNQRDAAHPSKASLQPGRATAQRFAARHTSRRAAPSSGYRSVASYRPAAAVQPVTTPAVASQTPATPIYQPTSSAARQASSTNTTAPSPASLLGPGHCACG